MVGYNCWLLQLLQTLEVLVANTDYQLAIAICVCIAYAQNFCSKWFLEFLKIFTYHDVNVLLKYVDVLILNTVIEHSHYKIKFILNVLLEYFKLFNCMHLYIIASSQLSLEQSLSVSWQTSPTDDRYQGSGGVLLTFKSHRDQVNPGASFLKDQLTCSYNFVRIMKLCSYKF